MKKNELIRYLGKNHQVLKCGGVYKIQKVFENDIIVITNTGFAGIPIEDCILIQI